MARTTDIQDLVQQFVDSLSSLIEQDTVSRAGDAVLNAFDGHAPAALVRGAGKLSGIGGKRRKGPIERCPVPGGSKRPAPAVGTACTQRNAPPEAQARNA